MRKICLLLLISVALTSFGQKAPAKFGNIPMEDMTMRFYPKDSSAAAVILVDYGVSTIEFDQNKGFQIIFERLRRVKILTKEGLGWADFGIPLYHSSSNDAEETLSELKVVTYNLENGKIVETKSKKGEFMKEKFDANTNVTKVAWANVKEGSVLEISYKVISDFLFNFQDWEFQDKIPTRYSEYRARIPEYFNYEKYAQGYIAFSVNENESVPNALTVDFKERVGGTGFSASKTEFHQERIDYQENRFRWAANDIPAFKKEPFMANSRDYISKINFELSFTKFPNQFTNPGIKRYMGTWEDISKTYWERVGEEITGNNSLKNQLDGILAGVTTSEQKVAAIFKFVRENVLWNGENRKYPENSPKKMLEEKKGSSAEINFLLASLLEKAEINVSPVLLSTRDHGFVREAMPVSTQFNYVVCLVKVDEKSILMDATDKFLPLGMLPERCLNGRGLAISKEGFQWISLQPATKTRTVFNTDLTLSESGELKGLLKIDKNGYSSADARKSYLTDGEKGYLKTFTDGRSWTLSKSEFQNVKELHLPFKETHELAISEHITEAGGTIYLSPFILAKAEENPFKQEKRTYPVDFAHPFDEMYLAKITIPNGYVIDEIPKSKVITLPENAARYSYNVAQAGNVINITSSLSINRSLFSQEEYPNLREFYSLLVAKQAEQIVLKKRQ